MLNILLDGVYELKRKIKSALDTAELSKETHVRLFIDKNNFNNVEKFLEDKNIDVVKMVGEKFYMIKHMRVELFKIDYYIS